MGNIYNPIKKCSKPKIAHLSSYALKLVFSTVGRWSGPSKPEPLIIFHCTSSLHSWHWKFWGKPNVHNLSLLNCNELGNWYNSDWQASPLGVDVMSRGRIQQAWGESNICRTMKSFKRKKTWKEGCAKQLTEDFPCSMEACSKKQTLPACDNLTFKKELEWSISDIKKIPKGYLYPASYTKQPLIPLRQLIHSM